MIWTLQDADSEYHTAKGRLGLWRVYKDEVKYKLELISRNDNESYYVRDAMLGKDIAELMEREGRLW